MTRLSKAHLAANVVLLPTAAPRQVNNYRFAEQRRAGMVAKKASPFHARYLHPHDREADNLAAEIAEIKQTPALLILTAMLNTMDREAVTKIVEDLAPGVVAGSGLHAQAVATVKASRLTVGGQHSLFRALDRLDAGRR